MLIRAVTVSITEHEVFVSNLEEFHRRYPNSEIQRIDGESQMKAPTRPGWYWRSNYITGEWEPVKVFIFEDTQTTTPAMAGELWCQDDTDNGNYYLVYDHGRWGGECLGMPF